MACINSDGTLVSSARAILNATRKSSTPDQIARATGLSLYRIRGGLRELTYAGLIGEANGVFQLTAEGEAKLAASQSVS